MYRLEREQFTKSPFIYLWSVLGFQAGFINAFGFLACGRYVSHVTGFGTQIGIALAQSDLWFALEFLGFPFSFILGAFVSGLLTIVRIERGFKPRLHILASLFVFLLVVLILLGDRGTFGDFGEQLVLARDFVLVFLLSFVCGMQNGCFAILTKGQIRTTHLTGISTDLGTDLARTWFGGLNSAELALTRRINLTRISTFVCFTVGSILSVIVSKEYEYHALSVPIFTSVGVFLTLWWVEKRLDVKLGSK